MNLKSRVIIIWGADGIDTVDQGHLKNSMLSTEAVKKLSEIGLPRWCAPNMNLDLNDGFKKDRGNTSNIHIGSDRDERLICLNRKTENVSALDFDGRSYSIASNLNEFLNFLIVYAEFVEAYLAEHVGFNFGTTFPEVDAVNNLIERLEDTCPNFMQKHSWWKMHLEHLINRNPEYFK